MWSFMFNADLFKSALSTYSFGKLVFLSFSVSFVVFFLNTRLSLQTSWHLHSHYLYRYHVFYDFSLALLFVRTYKNCASREVLNFLSKIYLNVIKNSKDVIKNKISHESLISIPYDSFYWNFGVVLSLWR